VSIYLGIIVACSSGAYRCIPLLFVPVRETGGQRMCRSAGERIRTGGQADTLDLVGILGGTGHLDSLVAGDIERAWHAASSDWG
jgi:hypothetical protein